MEIRRMPKEHWQSIYDISCRAHLRVADDGLHNPFAFTECAIEPLARSAPHQHNDQEIFFIVSGNGQMTIDEETRSVESGDLIFISPNTTHSLKNISPSTSLRFLSFAYLAPHQACSRKHTLVIPAPPTPNGELHLGHLSGPYLAADVFHRQRHQRGFPSTLSIGTDDNQCYIGNKARALNITNDDVVNRFRPAIHQGLKQFLFTPDNVLWPRGDDRYTSFIINFFSTLVDKGIVVVRDAPTPWCSKTEQEVFGADISGVCPHCTTRTLGHGCESCGHYNDGSDLIDLRSSVGNNVVIRTMQRFYLPLEEHREMLTAMIESCAMHPRLRKFYQDYLSAPLPLVSASHHASWGIDAPLTGQKIYEWIEMAGAYVYLMHEAREKRDATDISLVLSFGFDNSFFYGLVVPALIHGYDKTLPLPETFLSNYFYLLNNEKFSTSRNHAIWAKDFLRDYPADSVRFFLSLTRAEHKQTNFSTSAFTNFIKSTLIEKWFGFFTTINEELRSCDHQWLEVKNLQGFEERFVVDVKTCLWEIDEALAAHQFSLNRAAAKLMESMNLIIEFYERNRFYHQRTTLSLSLSAIASWAQKLSPLMPTLAQQILSAFVDVKLSAAMHVQKSSHTIIGFDLTFFLACQKSLSENA